MTRKDCQQMDTLDAVLAGHAADRPDQVAVVCDGRRTTYGTLHRESDRAADALRAGGLGSGARVAYLGRDSAVFYELLYACAKSGLVLVPVNWRLTAQEVEYLLRDSTAEVLFTERAFLSVVGEIRSRLPGSPPVVLVGEDDADAPVSAGEGPAPCTLEGWKSGAPEAEWPHASATDDPVLQMYTSGTTGFPKGAVLAHRSFFAVRDALAGSGLDWIDWRPGDVSLICVPSSHIGSVWWATQGFNAGITNVVMRAFDSREAVALIEGSGVTTTFLVPSMLRILLGEPELADTTFRTLRKVVYGGSPIPESLLRRSMDAMGCDFVQIYGLTETGNTAVCLPPEDHLRDTSLLQAAGRPYPGFELKIVDEDGKERTTGEVGEVCLRTPARMLGYWNLPDATATTLVDGWVHTGDAGYVDDDGYLFIRDRVKDMIIRAGENVYPAEIENALSAHPAVADVAVIGVPDERWGEAVLAFVVLRAGHEASSRELKTFLQDRIAEYKIPSKYRFADAVPRNASGKILRRALRDQFWSAQDRNVN